MADVPAVPSDPVLEARIQHALARYEGRLTSAALAEARAMLTVFLTTHPVLAPLLEQVRQGTAGAAPDTSGVVVKEGAPREASSAGAAPNTSGVVVKEGLPHEAPLRRPGSRGRR